MDIKVYEKGSEFALEHYSAICEQFPVSDFLMQNASRMNSFEDGYAICVRDSDDNKLLAQHCFPYNMVLAGDERMAWELYTYLKGENLTVTGLLGKDTVVEAFVSHCRDFKIHKRLQYIWR